MDAEDWIESVVRALMCLTGVLGNNWLGFSSLPKSKSQLKTSDILFINLALSNLITNYLVDLPDTMADFADTWFLGIAYCRVFNFCADLSETSSIFSTLFISVFWNQKLVGSLKRGGGPVRLDNLRLVAGLLAGSWTIAVTFSLPHLFYSTVKAGNESSPDCMDDFPSHTAKQTYEIMYLTLANAIPITGIVFTSAQIVHTLLQNQRRIKGHSTGAHEGMAEAPTDKEQSVAVTVSGNIGDADPSLEEPGADVPNGSSKGNVQDNSQPKASPARPPQPAAKANPSATNQVRAAKSVVAVASVFLVCWLTHLLLRITSGVQESSLVVEIASYIAASYTCIIPYIFLHGVKRLHCSCKR